MRKVIIFIFILNALSTAPQTFQNFLDRINSLPETQRQAIADSFMNSGIAVPFIENDTVVNFIYNAASQSVSMAGDATGWNPNQAFANITGCNFWYLTTKYENDARLDYKLVINTNNWILDPRNPNTCIGGFGPNSELRMPACLVPPEVSYYSNIPHGKIKDTTFHSINLGNNRTVKIYLPDGYPSGRESYPLILFHDGLEYIGLCKASNTLDYMIANHLITPVIAIFVPPVDRTEEYAGSKKDLFTNFIANELMPVIDTKYKTSKDPSQRAMDGASNGGDIALYIGIKHPKLFGKIAAQSSNVISEITSAISSGPKLNLSFYLDIGTYDIPELIPMVHNFKDLLQEKEYGFQFHEWHEGHSWGNWKEHLRYPLLQFFPYTSGLNEIPDNSGLILEQNRPNPFQGSTIIPFSVKKGEPVELFVSDLTGRKIETIYQSLGNDFSDFKISYQHKQKPGQYICTIVSNGFKVSKILTAMD